MKIPNHDRNSKATHKDRSPSGFSPEDFRMLVSGQSNSGKTNVVVHMIRCPLVYYDELYIYTNNHHQDKIKDLVQVFDNLSKKVGYDILKVESPDNILDTKEYPLDSRKVVIFDDVINEPTHVQKKIANHYTDGRQHNISPIYISQSYYDVPSKVRHNCSHLILFPPTTKRHYDLIAKENRVRPEFFDTLAPYEFLFLDKSNKRATKNFDEPIYEQHMVR